MSKPYEKIAWLDVESDGLYPYKGNQLLQIACIITDDKLNEINTGFMEKIYYSRSNVESMKNDANSFVYEMHEENGLWNSLPDGGKPLPEVEKLLLEEFNRYELEPGKTRLAGNSITLDRNFLNVYLPNVASFLSYRSLDMTSVAEFIENFRNDIKPFEKKKTHDALDDIRESLDEARYYSKYLKAL